MMGIACSVNLRRARPAYTDGVKFHNLYNNVLRLIRLLIPDGCEKVVMQLHGAGVVLLLLKQLFQILLHMADDHVI